MRFAGKLLLETVFHVEVSLTQQDAKISTPSLIPSHEKVRARK